MIQPNKSEYCGRNFYTSLHIVLYYIDIFSAPALYYITMYYIYIFSVPALYYITHVLYLHFLSASPLPYFITHQQLSPSTYNFVLLPFPPKKQQQKNENHFCGGPIPTTTLRNQIRQEALSIISSSFLYLATA